MSAAGLRKRATKLDPQAQLARPVAEADIFAKNATVPVCGQQP